jgi:predicted  nucleic acid-binding Zn-ribbon protein
MHPSVEQLLKVQAVDGEMRMLRQGMRLRPQELDSDRRRLKRAQAAVAEIVEEGRALRMQIDQGELEIKACDEEITNHNVTLNTVKTNAEYSVLTAQIEKLRETRSEHEEIVLEQLTALDALEETRRGRETVAEEEEKQFRRKEAELAELLQGLEARVGELSNQRTELSSGIDGEQLALYDRVLARHEDSAISVVRDRVCQGCFMTVTQQNISLLMLGRELIQCMNCGRLLYLE